MPIERSMRAPSPVRIAATVRRLLDASTLCAVATTSSRSGAHINTAYFGAPSWTWYGSRTRVPGTPATWPPATAPRSPSTTRRRSGANRIEESSCSDLPAKWPARSPKTPSGSTSIASRLRGHEPRRLLFLQVSATARKALRRACLRRRRVRGRSRPWGRTSRLGTRGDLPGTRVRLEQNRRAPTIRAAVRGHDRIARSARSGDEGYSVRTPEHRDRSSG